MVCAIHNSSGEEWPATKLKWIKANVTNRLHCTSIACQWLQNRESKKILKSAQRPLPTKHSIWSYITLNLFSRTCFDLPWSTVTLGEVLPIQLPFFNLLELVVKPICSEKLKLKRFFSNWKANVALNALEYPALLDFDFLLPLLNQIIIHKMRGKYFKLANSIQTCKIVYYSWETPSNFYDPKIIINHTCDCQQGSQSISTTYLHHYSPFHFRNEND